MAVPPVKTRLIGYLKRVVSPSRVQPVQPQQIKFNNPYRAAKLLEATVKYAVSRFSGKKGLTFSQLTSVFPELARIVPTEPSVIEPAGDKLLNVEIYGKGVINNFYRDFGGFTRMFTAPRKLFLLHDALPLFFLDQLKGNHGSSEMLCFHRSNLNYKYWGRIEKMMDHLLENSDWRGKPAGQWEQADKVRWKKFQQQVAKELKKLRSADPGFDRMCRQHIEYLSEYLGSGKQPIILVDVGHRGFLPAYIAGLFPKRDIFLFIAETNYSFFPRISQNTRVMEECGMARFVESTHEFLPPEVAVQLGRVVPDTSGPNYIPHERLLGQAQFVKTLQMLKMVYDHLA